MAVKTTVLPEKINPNHDHPIDIEAANKDNMFPFYFVIMMPNTIASFGRAYRTNDYSLAVLGLLVFLIFVLVDCCLVRYLTLPKQEKSSRKLWLKLTMWFLYTVISLGFVFLYSYFLSSQITVALYVVMFIVSVVILYAFIIAELVGDWKIRRSQPLDAGKSNHAYSVLENV